MSAALGKLSPLPPSCCLLGHLFVVEYSSTADLYQYDQLTCLTEKQSATSFFNVRNHCLSDKDFPQETAFYKGSVKRKLSKNVQP